jgi:hypothetical protein
MFGQSEQNRNIYIVIRLYILKQKGYHIIIMIKSWQDRFSNITPLFPILPTLSIEILYLLSLIAQTLKTP